MSGFSTWFAELNAAKKISYVVVLAAAISALVMLALWANQPDFQVLYANLSEDDAAKIVEELESGNVEYKVTAGGTIKVPKNVVYETRLSVAAKGFPKGGGVGFEIFDKAGFGVTEFVQKVNYLRAVQGELARTIGGLTEVETARVHIVVPEKRLFKTDGDGARASVVLKLTGSGRLRNDQIQGVVNLVAGAVEGLSSQNITVIDTSGRLLTRAIGDDGGTAMLTSNQLEYQRSIESGLEKRIQGILEPVIGVGKVIARVSAEVDFKQVEKTEERFDPDSVVVRSEQTNKEKTTSGSAGGGAPGVASNVPGAGGARGGGGSQIGSQRQNDTINYEISKIVSRTIEPTGAVKRLSVAVLVDGAREVTVTGEGEDAVEVSNYIARSEEDIAKYENLIKGVVGFVSTRGDTIEVVNIPFESQLPVGLGKEKEPTFLEFFMANYLSSLIRYGTILIIALLILFLVIRPMIAGIFKVSPELAAEGMGSLPPEAIAALEEGLREEEEEEEMPKSPMAKKKKTVKELVTNNPEQAAQIIKHWIKGRGDEE